MLLKLRFKMKKPRRRGIYVIYIDSAAIPPNKINIKIIPINEIHNPAIDKPFGVLNTPTKEKIKPNSQRIQPKKGIQPKNNAIMASTNPAVPIPLVFFTAGLTITVCAG